MTVPATMGMCPEWPELIAWFNEAIALHKAMRQP